MHVTQEGGGLRWTVRTENVRRFALEPDARAAALTGITLDGQTDLPLVRAPLGHYCRLATSAPWTVCYEGEDGAWSLNERSPTSSGPVLQVWDRPVLIVVGTDGASADLVERYRAAASQLASDYFHYSLGKAAILTDSEALEDVPDLGAFNLILLGGPTTNAVTATLAATLPGSGWSPVRNGIESVTLGNGSRMEDGTPERVQRVRDCCLGDDSADFLACFRAPCHSQVCERPADQRIRHWPAALHQRRTRYETLVPNQFSLSGPADSTSSHGSHGGDHVGLLFLGPWRAGVAVVIDGTDATGFDRAVEHFPIRTGTTVPDYGALLLVPQPRTCRTVH